MLLYFRHVAKRNNELSALMETAFPLHSTLFFSFLPRVYFPGFSVYNSHKNVIIILPIIYTIIYNWFYIKILHELYNGSNFFIVCLCLQYYVSKL